MNGGECVSVELIFGALALLLGLICIAGLITGVVSRTAGLHVARKTGPLAYWTYVVTWGLLALMAAWVAVQSHLTS